jgi:hypothetical protein
MPVEIRQHELHPYACFSDMPHLNQLLVFTLNYFIPFVTTLFFYIRIFSRIFTVNPSPAHSFEPEMAMLLLIQKKKRQVNLLLFGHFLLYCLCW